jgi:hypothetical protein
MNRQAEKTFKTINAYRKAKESCKQLILSKDKDNLTIACYQSLKFGFFPHFNKFAKDYLKRGENAKYIFLDYKSNSKAYYSRIDAKNLLVKNEIGIGVYEFIYTGGTYRIEEYEKVCMKIHSVDYYKYRLQNEIHRKITKIQHNYGNPRDQKCIYMYMVGLNEDNYAIDWVRLKERYPIIHEALIDRLNKTITPEITSQYE